MLNQWMSELGIEYEFRAFIRDNKGLKPGVRLTPQQQEDRPRLAIEFLKNHYLIEGDARYPLPTIEEYEQEMKKIGKT